MAFSAFYYRCRLHRRKKKAGEEHQHSHRAPTVLEDSWPHPSPCYFASWWSRESVPMLRCSLWGSIWTCRRVGYLGDCCRKCRASWSIYWSASIGFASASSSWHFHRPPDPGGSTAPEQGPACHSHSQNRIRKYIQGSSPHSVRSAHLPPWLVTAGLLAHSHHPLPDIWYLQRTPGKRTSGNLPLGMLPETSNTYKIFSGPGCWNWCCLSSWLHFDFVSRSWQRQTGCPKCSYHR